jgi:hypothetical protein
MTEILTVSPFLSSSRCQRLSQISSRPECILSSRLQPVWVPNYTTCATCAKRLISPLFMSWINANHSDASISATRTRVTVVRSTEKVLRFTLWNTYIIEIWTPCTALHNQVVTYAASWHLDFSIPEDDYLNWTQGILMVHHAVLR